MIKQTLIFVATLLLVLLASSSSYAQHLRETTNKQNNKVPRVAANTDDSNSDARLLSQRSRKNKRWARIAAARRRRRNPFFCRRTGTKLGLKIINLTRAQPFAPDFFVMIHRPNITPLFEFNRPASAALASLAEDGNSQPLIDMYSSQPGVKFAGRSTGPSLPGNPTPLYIDISGMNRRFSRVTIASMFVNSNDGFVAINGMSLRNGQVLYLDGYDAGSEENNEQCDSIPGPACADISTDNFRATENAEGFVHVHTGFIGDGPDGLTAGRYDWRNPMVRVEVGCFPVGVFGGDMMEDDMDEEEDGDY